MPVNPEISASMASRCACRSSAVTNVTPKCACLSTRPGARDRAVEDTLRARAVCATNARCALPQLTPCTHRASAATKGWPVVEWANNTTRGRRSGDQSPAKRGMFCVLNVCELDCAAHCGTQDGLRRQTRPIVRLTGFCSIRPCRASPAPGARCGRPSRCAQRRLARAEPASPPPLQPQHTCHVTTHDPLIDRVVRPRFALVVRGATEQRASKDEPVSLTHLQCDARQVQGGQIGQLQPRWAQHSRVVIAPAGHNVDKFLPSVPAKDRPHP